MLIFLPVQDDAARKGMHWNAHALRWEGNDSALHSFSLPPSASPPRPALITNMNPPGPSGVQVHGGMVFDPQRMCWLKMGRRLRADSNVSIDRSQPQQAPMNADAMEQDEDEEDPFAGIEDLKDDSFAPHRQSGGREMNTPASKGRGAAGSDPMALDARDVLPVHEEFDLGPEFIRRQREEESIWRSRVGPWFPEGTEIDWYKEREREGQVWKWAIRDIASEVEMM